MREQSTLLRGPLRLLVLLPRHVLLRREDHWVPVCSDYLAHLYDTNGPALASLRALLALLSLALIERVVCTLSHHQAVENGATVRRLNEQLLVR